MFKYLVKKHKSTRINSSISNDMGFFTKSFEEALKPLAFSCINRKTSCPVIYFSLLWFKYLFRFCSQIHYSVPSIPRQTPPLLYWFGDCFLLLLNVLLHTMSGVRRKYIDILEYYLLFHRAYIFFHFIVFVDGGSNMIFNQLFFQLKEFVKISLD